MAPLNLDSALLAKKNLIVVELQVYESLVVYVLICLYRLHACSKLGAYVPIWPYL